MMPSWRALIVHLLNVRAARARGVTRRGPMRRTLLPDALAHLTLPELLPLLPSHHHLTLPRGLYDTGPAPPS